MKEIQLLLGKELKEKLVARNCDLIAGCLHASFNVIEDDDKPSLRFITIRGNFCIIEKEKEVIILDNESINAVLLSKDLIYKLECRF